MLSETQPQWHLINQELVKFYALVTPLFAFYPDFGDYNFKHYLEELFERVVLTTIYNRIYYDEIGDYGGAEFDSRTATEIFSLFQIRFEQAGQEIIIKNPYFMILVENEYFTNQDLKYIQIYIKDRETTEGKIGDEYLLLELRHTKLTHKEASVCVEAKIVFP